MKKILSSFILTLALMLICAPCFASGSSVTQTGTGYGVSELSGIRGATGMLTVTLLLTSDSSTGAVTDALSTSIMSQIMGKYVVLVECIPDAVDTPSNLYDLTITNTTTGIDIMGGALADRTSTTTGDQAVPNIGEMSAYRPVNGNLTINGSNMGNSKKTKVVITLQ